MNFPFTGVKVKQYPTFRQMEIGQKSQASVYLLKSGCRYLQYNRSSKGKFLRQLVSTESKHKNRGFGTNYHQVSLSSGYISRNILGVKFQMLCSDGSKIYDI